MALVFGKSKKFFVLECDGCKHVLSFNENQIEEEDPKNNKKQWLSRDMATIYGGAMKQLDYYCPICDTFKTKSFYNHGLCTWIDDVTYASMRIIYNVK